MKLPRQVYAIQHNVTKKIYIGSSAMPNERYLNHVYRLRKGVHPVKDMQNDFDKFGENYSFFILDEITNLDECVKEYEWMKKYNAHIPGIGYNYMDKATNHIHGIAYVPYRKGVPEQKTPEQKTLNENKKQLYEIIETMTDNQILYLLTFVNRLFGKGDIQWKKCF